jgi:polysaccharide deacetylase 2 family uncharacterized protein YibQ
VLKRNQQPLNRLRFFLISLLPLITFLAQANEPSTNSVKINPDLKLPTISIIIDDMGYRLKAGSRAVNLSGDITYSFLPHTPYARQLSQLAHAQNKEVMLHLPMQAESGKKLGPGGLTVDMTEQKFIEVLESSINSIPYVSGFNNHMGSLLTKDQLWMKKLMHKVAANKKLFFVDSKTTSESIALKIARAEGLQSTQRDIFIDHENSKKFILQQLEKLIKRARRKGTALAIAHPKKTTLSVLEKWLPELEKRGIRLVFVSKLIRLQQQRRLVLWKKAAQH